ncbi:type VI secretion system baseplate subunit TssF [Acerihabitans arboris]|uniref:Type VI secretion system baseplate subunit TssF n=1 Tax=Acerihabitans arboris TaxID=2691583 RepID=A0A845STM1_9GAMM|nr:type VI secretion system baseplate subunit TssF [Acerihabitans arboris]NDL64395.1 type VI secretion system baseplate subunit TssF [Acerihabitans arboris]
MDSRLLDYYNRELAWLREMGTEFAEHYPKVAGRLGIGHADQADPYVERLLEGVAFLTARVQLKMDAEFPRFSRQLLDMLHPNYLAATPSMAIVELQPDAVKGDISRGFKVPRGTIMDSPGLKSRGVTCRYRTAHEVDLQPLRIEQVDLGGMPADICPAALGLDGSVSALRIKLSCLGHVTLGEMRCDRLTFYLSGGDIPAPQLLELIMQHTQTILVQTGDAAPRRLQLGRQALCHEGLDACQAMLPADARNLDAFRLLQEYFCFPARLQFFSIQGLQPLFDGGGNRQQLEIILLLDQAAPDLERRVDRQHLALHCTPVVNLFPRAAERIILNERQGEYPVIVDTLHPQDYEVHSIVHLHGRGPQGENGYRRIFRPFYDRRSEDGPGDTGWFSLRREQRPWPATADPLTPYTGYSGSQAFISLADERHPPWHGELAYLSAEVLCSNRDLPLRLAPQDQRLVLRDSLPVQRVVLRNGPSRPRPALAESESCWPLVNQLQLNCVSLLDNDAGDSGAALRQLLHFHARQADITVRQQIAGIRQCLPVPCHRVMAPPALARRGVSLRLSVDEQAFSGVSPWLLGSVLARLFTRLVTINSFSETTLTSVQRGKIGYWPPCPGVKAAL